MLKKLFKKKNDTTVTLYSPVDGEVISLTDVPDPVFSEKMMGDGIAVKPVNGTIVAPIEGKVVQVFPTKHAVGIQTNNGLEILIHIGLETVGMQGEGFESFVEVEDVVKVGDKLITFNKNLVNEMAASDIVPIVITNTTDMKSIQPVEKGEVRAGQDVILTIVVK
ncbi:PTS sugar transporter subunit IIA [Oceanobacillus caeni]|uniref:PTS sugar transporter subunit IIA n=1 Tax=Oceanobacillus caeni TaxID=405946 RepID=UPI001957983E